MLAFSGVLGRGGFVGVRVQDQAKFLCPDLWAPFHSIGNCAVAFVETMNYRKVDSLRTVFVAGHYHRFVGSVSVVLGRTSVAGVAVVFFINCVWVRVVLVSHCVMVRFAFKDVEADATVLYPRHSILAVVVRATRYVRAFQVAIGPPVRGIGIIANFVRPREATTFCRAVPAAGVVNTVEDIRVPVGVGEDSVTGLANARWFPCFHAV